MEGRRKGLGEEEDKESLRGRVEGRFSKNLFADGRMDLEEKK